MQTHALETASPDQISFSFTFPRTKKENHSINVATIKQIVASCFDIGPRDLASNSRLRSVARPRQVAMYLARQLTPRSTVEIGKLFSRDHSTVVHAIRQIERLRSEDISFDQKVATVERKILNL